MTLEFGDPGKDEDGLTFDECRVCGFQLFTEFKNVKLGAKSPNARFRIVCLNCNKVGPEAPTKAEALKLWNAHQ